MKTPKTLLTNLMKTTLLSTWNYNNRQVGWFMHPFTDIHPFYLLDYSNFNEANSKINQSQL